MYLAKTKALISFVVTVKLICVFVFAYAKIRFSHDVAHLIMKFPSLFSAKLEDSEKHLKDSGDKVEQLQSKLLVFAVEQI